MKRIKTTNRNFINNIAVIEAPCRSVKNESSGRAKKLFLLLLTVALFVLMVKLGFWQLARGDQKVQIEQALLAKQNAVPISLSQWLQRTSPRFGQQGQIDQQAQKVWQHNGVKIAVTVTHLSLNSGAKQTPQTKIILLDNQTWQGKVGYLAFQVVKIQDPLTSTDPTNERITEFALLELGFVVSGSDRRILPVVTMLETSQHIVGRLYRKQVNPMSESLMAESGWPMRIQNLSIPALATKLNLPLFDHVIQPLSVLALEKPLPHPWKPIPMTSTRHFGYAIQWFCMALVLALLSLWFGYQIWQSNRKTIMSQTTKIKEPK
ncbi:SURF1 family protein [Vibrio sp. S11_S32]|uniref:SURF1 family protein n=1 Tax=Vibrio sp. S11_S32 TaxID=2720225 RepID=UPI001EEECD21|nr:SURF1 family protein [Vibrio sp. S11_S32]